MSNGDFETVKVIGKHRDDLGVIVRECVRGILFYGGGRIILVQSNFGDVSFPGGGVENGENLLDALERELREELGYKIEKRSIKPYCRIDVIFKNAFQKGTEIRQVNYFYLCEGEKVYEPRLSENEKLFGVKVISIDVDAAMEINKKFMGNGYHWIDRDLYVLECLKDLF